MIDVHAHILPGVDDGAADLDDARRMARTALADGVATIVATPHASVERPRTDVARLVDRLQAALGAAGLPLRVLPGAEIALSADVPARLADGTLPRLAGSRYALIELPFGLPPPARHLEQMLFETQLAGFTPVLAHVERYRYLEGAVEQLADWCDRGAVLQMTAGSLRGDFGPGPREAAARIVRARLRAVLASDAHDGRRRQPELRYAWGLAAAVSGEARARDLLVSGPEAIVADRPFPAPSPRAGGDDARSFGLARARDLLRRAFRR